MTPEYRYLLCDLLTDTPLAFLPLTGVTFDRRISRVGSLSATLNATTPQLVAAAKLLHRYAGRSALWVQRGDALWWGGIPWTVKAAQGPRDSVVCTVSAATFDSYAHRRQLYTDVTYTQVDQGVIIPDLWRTIQSDSRGDIGVEALDQPTGKLRDRTYLAADGDYVGQLIEDLGDVIEGPEHTIDVWLDGSGTRRKTLRVANQLGVSEPRVVFHRGTRDGGRLVTWEHTADAVDGGTTFVARGEEGIESDRLYADDLLDAGWPLLDLSEDHPGAILPDTLAEWAEALQASQAGALQTHAYTVQVGSTGWDPNRIGDPVRIKLRDQWHTQQASDMTVRPVGVRVTAADATTPEQIELIFGDD